MGPQDAGTLPCEQEEGWGSRGLRAGWSTFLGNWAPGAGPPEPWGMCHGIRLREKNTSLRNTGRRFTQSVCRCRPDWRAAGGCVSGGDGTARPWLARRLGRPRLQGPGGQAC